MKKIIKYILTPIFLIGILSISFIPNSYSSENDEYQYQIDFTICNTEYYENLPRVMTNCIDSQLTKKRSLGLEKLKKECNQFTVSDRKMFCLQQAEIRGQQHVRDMQFALARNQEKIIAETTIEKKTMIIFFLILLLIGIIMAHNIRIFLLDKVIFLSALLAGIFAFFYFSIDSPLQSLASIPRTILNPFAVNDDLIKKIYTEYYINLRGLIGGVTYFLLITAIASLIRFKKIRLSLPNMSDLRAKKWPHITIILIFMLAFLLTLLILMSFFFY